MGMRREPTSDGRRRRGHPPPLSALPLRPLLLLRHPPPLPPHVSSPCILILPIIPTSSLGNPSALLPLPPLPPPRRPPPRERKGIGISKGKRSWKAREGRRRDDDSRLLSIGLSFQPPAFNWHSLPWREKETASPLCVCTRTCVGACTSFGHFWQAVTLRSRVLAEGRGEFGRRGELIILAVTCA